ncbi:aspartate ammonia-lyase [Rhizobacter sp. Root1221]|uniref:aspartate ammonia-lyase n=1 Tax=Rhizobacter sp. Root1221 TaxID=1736433 RepID=UPI001F2BE1E2|nr:aspartate ammonia-lyase [Rhizobacter sp. Root1221]
MDHLMTHSNPTNRTNPTNAREEHDFLGSMQIPHSAYWGIHAARAMENFPISGRTIGECPDLIWAMAQVKKASVIANAKLGVVKPEIAKAITAACDEVIGGALHEHFVVDVIQGGAGTSTNMNANEVIANRALELLNAEKGRYDLIHPNDHVNASQSTNDVYPTALRLAAWRGIDHLLVAMRDLRVALEGKAVKFADVLKIGRTQLQDAVPMTLGQEFLSFAIMIGEDELRLSEARLLITEVNLGATAIGTGINAPAGYSATVIPLLAEISGIPVVKAANLIEATQDTGAFVQLSGVLKRVACKLSKICNDLRLLSSGPQAGFGEIFLPARQAGSSIMPGKVNPVIPEVVNQIAFEVIGNDMTITMASEGGQLQLNAFEPIIAWSLHKSIMHLTHGCRTLQHHCIEGIEANRPLLARRVAESVTLVTALNPFIGYEKSAAIAKRVLRHGGTIADAVQDMDLMSASDLAALLVPERLTQPVAERQARPAADVV